MKNKIIRFLIAIIATAAMCVAVCFIRDFLAYLLARTYSPIKLIACILLWGYIAYNLYKIMDNEEGGEE